MEAVKIAEYVLWYLNEKHDIKISNLRLQKYLFLCQCNSLAVSGETLFEEDFDVWAHGPVVKSVYFKYCVNGNLNILNVPDEKPLLYNINTKTIDDMLDYLVAENMRYSDLVSAIMNFTPVKRILTKRELVPAKDRNRMDFPLSANELKRFLT